MIKMIAAVSQNGVIGVTEKEVSKIPWSYPEDMDFFRKMTNNSIVIMGRKTFESIGKPLPGRKNIVVSSQSINIENVETVSSVEEAIKLFENDSKNIWLIGGSSIYESGLLFANEIYITLIPKLIDLNNKNLYVAKFPWINPSIFKCQHYKYLSDDVEVIKYTRFFNNME